MSDESIIVKGNGTIFLAGPPLVKAATGEEVTAEELGGADVHTSQSGVADHFAEDEPEALRMVRNIVENIGPRTLAPAAYEEPELPAHDVEDLLGLIPNDNRTPVDVKELIARIVDGSRFHEFKSRYGTTLICGFAHIHGHKVGIVANNGILFSESSLKGAHFVELCVNGAYLWFSFKTLQASWLVGLRSRRYCQRWSKTRHCRLVCKCA